MTAIQKSRIKSFGWALNGFLHTLSTQRNFQIQLLLGAIVILFAYFFSFSGLEWAILLLTIALVLTAEMLNTVVEVVVDLAVKEKLLPEARIAKDVAAGAVLTIAFFAVLIGLFLFLPHVAAFLSENS